MSASVPLVRTSTRQDRDGSTLLPPLAGFAGKWYLFVAVLNQYAEGGGAWYVALAIVAALLLFGIWWTPLIAWTQWSPVFLRRG